MALCYPLRQQRDGRRTDHLAGLHIGDKDTGITVGRKAQCISFLKVMSASERFAFKIKAQIGQHGGYGRACFFDHSNFGCSS